MNSFLLLLLMSLTAYRATRLVVKDTFPPMLWVRDRLVGGWRTMTEGEKSQQSDSPSFFPTAPTTCMLWPEGWQVGYDSDGEPLIKIKPWEWVPAWLSELVSCPWCASGWLSLGVVAASDAVLGVPSPVLMWGGVWALGAILAAQDNL